MIIIKDKFSKLKISKQRRYQLRRNHEGRCYLCGEKLKHYKGLCDECMDMKLDQAAEKRKNGRRWRDGGPGRPPRIKPIQHQED